VLDGILIEKFYYTRSSVHGSELLASTNDRAILLGLCVSFDRLPYIALLSLDGLKRVGRVSIQSVVVTFTLPALPIIHINLLPAAYWGCVREEHVVAMSAIFLFQSKVSDIVS
jgi:hypothetical protein